MKEQTVERPPGLSVRVKLTLSYVGFLMVAGVLMLAAVWVVLLRYIPDGVIAHLHPSWWIFVGPLRPVERLRRNRSLRARGPARVRSRRRVAARRPDARALDAHHRGHSGGGDRSAVASDPAPGAQRRAARARRQLRRHARPARSAGCRAAAVRGQCVPRAAHPARDHADAARGRPQRSRVRHEGARRPAPRRQHPSDRPHRSAARAQSRRPTVVRPRRRRPVARRGGSHGDAPPVRRTTRRHHRDLGRAESHRRLTPAPAADDHEPRAQRDRPQPAWRRHGVGDDPRAARRSGAHGREHRRAAHAHRTSPPSPSRSSVVPNEPTRDHAGVGLGLAIVESIAAAHDGTVTLVPRTAGGLCVTVRLPESSSRVVDPVS